MLQKDLTDDIVTIDSGNGLVLSSNKPLPEQMLTKFYMASISHNKLIKVSAKLKYLNYLS